MNNGLRDEMQDEFSICPLGDITFMLVAADGWKRIVRSSFRRLCSESIWLTSIDYALIII